MVRQESGLRAAMNARIIGCSASGGRDAIILAHGYGGDQSLWDKIVPALAENHRVLVFDWSFSGAVKDPNLFDPLKYSTYEGYAADLISLLDEMELKSSVLVGHSMSGMIGCIASIKRPDLFKRLILVGASPRCINTDDYEGGFKKSDIEAIINDIETNFHNWASRFASIGVGGAGGDNLPSVAKFTKCLQNMNPQVALSVAKTVFYSDERSILERVLTPCTIVQTTNDPVVPYGVACYMKEKIRGECTVEMIEVDGHFPQLTAHVQLLDIINEVLGS